MATLNNAQMIKLIPGCTAYLAIILFIFLLMPGSLSAQGKKPDFSGKWTLNESKSKLDEGPSWGTAIRMTIQHNGNNLTAERVSRNRDGDEMTTTDKLTLDGKECNNSTEGRTRTSKASWATDGNSLTIITHMVFERDGQSFESDATEVFKLQDKNALVIEYKSVSQRGERQRTLVYDKSN